MEQVNREQLMALLEPAVEGLGFELADMELRVAGSAGLLRLFIDREEGITVEHCAEVSRQISALLDVEDPIPGDYSLEVSSPGLDRRLAKPAHFERFAGNKVRIRLKRLVDGRRNYNGQLLGYKDPNVLVEEGQESFAIPLQEIDSARLVPEF